MSRGQLSGGWGIVLGGNCAKGVIVWVAIIRGVVVQGVIVWGGSCLGVVVKGVIVSGGGGGGAIVLGVAIVLGDLQGELSGGAFVGGGGNCPRPIYNTCNLVTDIQCTRYKNSFSKRF